MTPRLRGRKGVEQRKRRLARSNGLCEPCLVKGIIRVATQVDHTIPLSEGGPDTDENTSNMCDECHAAKTRNDMGWRAKPATGPDGWPMA